jgi:hypothetical protein
MKKALPYIAAFLAGLFARTAVAALNGWEGYHMNGVDLICGVTCIVMVWAFKGAFLPRKSTERRKTQRENSDSLRGKPDRLL